MRQSNKFFNQKNYFSTKLAVIKSTTDPINKKKMAKGIKPIHGQTAIKHYDLSSVYQPFYKFFKIFGLLSYTVCETKKSDQYIAISVQKFDAFKFIVINTKILSLIAFNIYYNFHTIDLKSVLLTVGMRSVVAGGLSFCMFGSIYELFNRNRIAALINLLHEFDTEV